MSSYQDILKDMFNKHKGKYASKDLMRMASMEWNKIKGSKGKKMSGRGLPDDPSMLTGAGMPKKVRQPRLKSVVALGPSTEIPNFDSTGVSPYGEYQAKNAIKSLPANNIQVLKQLNFSGPRRTKGGNIMEDIGKNIGNEMAKQLSGGDYMETMGKDVGDDMLKELSGGSFWDDFSSGFSSVFSTVAPFLPMLL
jgi:hypothetical protein